MSFDYFRTIGCASQTSVSIMTVAGWPLYGAPLSREDAFHWANINLRVPASAAAVMLASKRFCHGPGADVWELMGSAMRSTSRRTGVRRAPFEPRSEGCHSWETMYRNRLAKFMSHCPDSRRWPL